MQQDNSTRNVFVLGAAGLIGRSIAENLRLRHFNVTGIARRYPPSQKATSFDLEMPLLSLEVAALVRLLQEREIDVVVNCIGVLQDGPGIDTHAVHCDFVQRLLVAIEQSGRATRLVHISIPKTDDEDATRFSQTKREAEKLIASSHVTYAILRPGFVIAPAAYGGSAMLRALAALPFDLPATELATPFQPVAIEDIVATIAWLAERNVSDPLSRNITWDLMQLQSVNLGQVIDQFRHALGTTNSSRITMPAFVLDLGAKLGDLSNLLGWTPPIRSAAIVELRRGVSGDPAIWSTITGIKPIDVSRAVAQYSATIQNKWFGRLFLVKALTIVSLAVFWIASGFIALVPSYAAAAAILTSHHFPPTLVGPLTVGTSLMDMTIGVLIAIRRTSAVGLVAGIVASLGYMIGSAIFTPDLWLEPLGALVKTGPAIVLMLIALCMADNR